LILFILLQFDILLRLSLIVTIIAEYNANISQRAVLVKKYFLQTFRYGSILTIAFFHFIFSKNKRFVNLLRL